MLPFNNKELPCITQMPCQNNAVCENDKQGDYECKCPVGYAGKNCEIGKRLNEIKFNEDLNWFLKDSTG